MLETLGFSPVEVSVYELLVSRGRCSLEEVLGQGDRGRRRQALERLEAKGLIRRTAGPDHSFVVAPPEYAIDVLVAEQMSALQQVRARSAELAAKVREVAQGVDPAELIEIVSGEGSARQLFRQVVSSARDEIAVFDSPPYSAFGAAEREDVTQAQTERLTADGLSLRTVFDRSLLEDPAEVARIMRGISVGEQGRVAQVPLKLAIVDHEWGMLPLLHADAQTPEAVMIVRQSVLLDSMIALFESVWQHAVEIRSSAEGGMELAAADEDELKQLARLLATGMTDVAIASHLRISERTLRRRIKELMADLRVESRFEAGVRAAERGWA